MEFPLTALMGIADCLFPMEWWVVSERHSPLVRAQVSRMCCRMREANAHNHAVFAAGRDLRNLWAASLRSRVDLGDAADSAFWLQAAVHHGFLGDCTAHLSALTAGRMPSHMLRCFVASRTVPSQNHEQRRRALCDCRLVEANARQPGLPPAELQREAGVLTVSAPLEAAWAHIEIDGERRMVLV